MNIILFIIYIKILLALGLIGNVAPINQPPPTQTIKPIIQTIPVNIYEQRINDIRAENGIRLLQADNCLRDRAGHRLDEINVSYSHITPTGAFATADRYCDATKKGENLARYVDTGDFIDSWLNSETHKKVILNPAYTKIGIIKKDYYVVMEVSN